MTREEIEKEIVRLRDGFNEEAPPQGLIIHRDTFFNLLSSLTEMEASRDDWKRNWHEQEARLKQAEEKVREIDNKRINFEFSLGCVIEERDKLQANLSKLGEAVERHRKNPKETWIIHYQEDEELYRTRDEVGKEKNV